MDFKTLKEINKECHYAFGRFELKETEKGQEISFWSDFADRRVGILVSDLDKFCDDIDYLDYYTEEEEREMDNLIELMREKLEKGGK